MNHAALAHEDRIRAIIARKEIGDPTLDIAAIAAEWGVDRTTIYWHMRKYGWRSGYAKRRPPEPGLCVCGCGEKYLDSHRAGDKPSFAPGHNQRVLGQLIHALRDRDNKTFASLAATYCLATRPSERDGSTNTRWHLNETHCLCGCWTLTTYPFAQGHHIRPMHNLVHALSGSGNLLVSPDDEIHDPEQVLEVWRERDGMVG